jgi:RHS repeat-associated protein
MEYTFTGQASYMDDPITSETTEGFGLMFFNARWLDPAIGRFTQADSIVPGGVQGLDRYAYVNNNPVRYTDPSGHTPVCVMGGAGGCLVWAGLTGRNSARGYEGFTNDIDANLDRYGVKLVDGNKTWSMRNKSVVLTAVALIAVKMESAKNRSGVELFRESFDASSTNPIIMVMGTSALGIYLGDGSDSKSCANIGSGGCTVNSHTINFVSLFPNGYFASAVNNVIHELGHAFNGGHDSNPMNAVPDDYVKNRESILLPTVTFTYQMNYTKDPSETFADFFVAWTLNAWQTSVYGGPASSWMDNSMAGWLP